MRKLLVCICYHHGVDADLQVLFKTIHNIKTSYDFNVHIVIHTNSDASKQLLIQHDATMEVIVASNMQHPHHLAWQHRSYIKDHLHEHDVVMYVEHDIIITGAQVNNYLENIQHMWPHHCPALVRYERSNDGCMYAVEVTPATCKNRPKVHLNDVYMNVGKIYSACWILPTHYLKQVITDDFSKIPPSLHLTREYAASFVNWTLQRPLLMQLTPDGKCVSPRCCIYHASNRYINDRKQPDFSKHRIADLLS